jgi:DNA-binding MarR family transcriptional regulator
MAKRAGMAKSAAGRASAADSPWRELGRAGERLAVQEFPTFLFERIASLAKRKLTKQYLDRWGLSMPEWRLLNIVARLSPTNFGAIMQLSTMDKAQISLTLRSLAYREWIAIGNAEPGRGERARRPSRVVTITAAGRATIRKVLPDARRAQTRLLAQLTAEERVRLYALLRKTLDTLNGLDA